MICEENGCNVQACRTHFCKRTHISRRVRVFVYISRRCLLYVPPSVARITKMIHFPEKPQSYICGSTGRIGNSANAMHIISSLSIRTAMPECQCHLPAISLVPSETEKYQIKPFNTGFTLLTAAVPDAYIQCTKHQERIITCQFFTRDQHLTWSLSVPLNQ